MEPTGYEPYEQQGQMMRASQQSGGGSTAGVAQLFARLSQEIEENKPKNCIHFVVDFLCKHYPEHLHGFASIWQMDPDLEGERHEVVNFFKAHKISTAVAAHFANAGYDTLDTLTTLSPDGLVDIEAFNNVKWLPGHKVRLQQIFGEISARVRAYREQVQMNRPAPGAGQPGARSFPSSTAARHTASPAFGSSGSSPLYQQGLGHSPLGGQSALGAPVKEAGLSSGAPNATFPFHATQQQPSIGMGGLSAPSYGASPFPFSATPAAGAHGLAGGAPPPYSGMQGAAGGPGLHHPNLYLAA